MTVTRLPGAMTELEIALRDGWLERHGKLIVHGPKRCAGQPCALHNPSPHYMNQWPLVVLADRIPPLIERVCSHGVGHPDPDSLSWAKTTSSGIHGCDGCCRA